MYTHIYFIDNIPTVTGQACCVNQYHYESREQRIVMRRVNASGKTSYKVLYQYTMDVISMSEIPIKKQLLANNTA